MKRSAAKHRAKHVSSARAKRLAGIEARLDTVEARLRAIEERAGPSVENLRRLSMEAAEHGENIRRRYSFADEIARQMRENPTGKTGLKAMPAPLSLEDWKKMKSVPFKILANGIGLSVRTLSERVKEGRLEKTKSTRIRTDDDLFEAFYTERYGSAVKK